MLDYWTFYTKPRFKSLGLKAYPTELNLQLSTVKPYLFNSMAGHVV